MFEKQEEKWNIKFLLKNTALISYPKSGRTWLRMILASVLDYSGQDISKYEMLPAFHDTPEEMFGRMNQKLSTNPEYNLSKLKILFLHRDPGDVVLSSYHAMTNSTESDARLGVFYKGTITEFIRKTYINRTPDQRASSGWEADGGYSIDKIIEYNNKWYNVREGYRRIGIPESFKVVTYEEMHQDPFKTIKGILDWAEYDCGDEVIKKAIKYSEFENMWKIEHGHGKNNLEH